MKILVTGANGYIGQGVTKQLLDMGVNVIATDIADDYIDARSESMPCDLFNIANPYNYFGEPDAVFHLAWRDGFNHQADSHLKDLFSHCIFLKKMAEAGVKKIAVMGTMHEVGFYEGCIKEYTPCNPTTPYAISKNALRQHTKTICEKSDIKFQWLRGYYIVGNTSRGNSIFSKITEAEREGKTEFPFTLGQNQFDFIDYDDFCYQIAATLIQDEVLGIINISSGSPERLSERVERFIRENNYKIKLKYGAFPERDYESKALWGDDTKIKRILEHRNA